MPSDNRTERPVKEISQYYHKNKTKLAKYFLYHNQHKHDKLNGDELKVINGSKIHELTR